MTFAHMSIRKITIFFAICVFLPTHAISASLLRDADIEQGLNRLAAPILQSSGLGPNNIRILVIDDMKLNAFVIDNKHIFLNAGLILATKSPEMLQAVIAHEAAHIANGHISRRIQNMRSAQTATSLGIALALATGAATDNHALGSGIALGVSGSAKRVFFAHTRAEEASADAAAIAYMVRAGIDPRGKINVLEIFEGQENLNTNHQDVYVRTHPLTRDRIRAVSATAQAQKKFKANIEMEYWHSRVLGKLSAFKHPSNWTHKRTKNSSANDIKHMRIAIALMKEGKTNAALAELQKAQSMRKNDAYYQDLRAELLMRNQNFKQAEQQYHKAVKMAPNNALILAGLGRAQLANGQIKQAIKTLEKSRSRDFRNSNMMRDLALAYARNGDNAMASLATAERFALNGKLRDAKIHAKRASDMLSRGSISWQRAQDILSYDTN